MVNKQSQTQNVCFKRGDTVGFELEFKDQTGAPIDITGWKFFLTMKSSLDDADGSAVIAVDVTAHSDPTNGKTLIKAPDGAADSLDGDYYYDIQYKDTSGVIETVMSGIASFDKDVTQRSA